MFGVSDEQKRWMESSCMCPECPTGPDETKKVYCYNDRSAKKPDPVACICPACDVYRKKNFLGTNYYCITGRPMTRIAGVEIHEAVSGGK
jgi:hypothetical protein